MKSPFPGMDPYLETYWREVHQRLVIYSGDVLQTLLPEPLHARVEERVFVESEAPRYRSIYPDVHVVEQRPRSAAPKPSPAAELAVDEPLLVHLDDEPLTQGFIEIVDAGSGNRVITVIEFLSPSNKIPGEGQELYLQKQREVTAAGASLVEIDLTRTGRRVLSLPPERIPPSHRTTYQVCVRRGGKPNVVEVYRAGLDERLPIVRIPLRETDEDVPLALQPLVNRCYENGRYDNLDYRSEPVPPLEPSDTAWADAMLREKGLR
jgi:hypothetical protein